MPGSEPKPETVAVDTSVVVAAHQSWHQHHAAARAGIDRTLAEDEIVLPTRVLLESFSVMTRMPVPHRLDPADALTLLSKTFEGSARVVDLPVEEYWALLRAFAERGVVGGAAYDGEIIECSIRAGATKILTFNRSDFERLAPDGIRIVIPEDEARDKTQ